MRHLHSLATFAVVLVGLLLDPAPTAAWAQADPCSGSSTGPCAFARADTSGVTHAGTFYYDWPDGAGGDISYGASAFGISEDGDYIYIGCSAGNDQRGIAKLSIPALGGTATVVTPCSGPNRAEIETILPYTPWDAGQPLLGGVTEVAGNIVVNAYGSYDANDSATASHWMATSLSGLSANGPYLGTVSTGLVKSQMGQVPTEWRTLLGGPAFATSGYTSIISRQSDGASMTIFDPANVTGNGFAMQMLIGCPHTVPACQTWTAWGPSDDFTYQGSELAGGSFIIPGTRTFIAVEREGEGAIPSTGGSVNYEGYGYATTNPAIHGDPYLTERWLYSLSDPLDQKGNKGYPYKLVAKHYDLKEAWDVKQGTKTSPEVQPYAVSVMPTSAANTIVTNGAYNNVRNEFYLVKSAGGGLNSIEVFRNWGANGSGGAGEQILGPFKTGATCTLASGINSSTTTITVASGCGTKLPTPGSDGVRAIVYNATDYPDGYSDPDYEVVTITGISTDTLTVATRGGIEGTSAVAHNTGGKTYVINVGVTEDTLNKLDTANDASYVALGTNSGLPGERVLTAGTAIGLTDAGAGSTVTVAVNDVELTSIAGLTSAANKVPYYTGSGTASVADFTAGGRALVNSAGTADTFPYFSASNTVTLGSITAAGRAVLDDADAAAQRTTLGLAIGTNVQAQDAELAALAGTTSSADALPYYSGSGTATTTTITATGRSILDDTSTGAVRTTLGVGTGDSPTFAGATLSGLTATRVPYASTGGLLADDANLLWDASADKLYLSPVATAYPGSDPSAVQLVRTITTPPNTPPGAVNPLVGISGEFAQSGAVNQGRIGIGVTMADHASVVNKTISGTASDGGEVAITATAHGFANGDRINVYGVTGTTEANGVWTIEAVTANTFRLDGSTFSNAWVSGGTATNRGLYYAGHFNVSPTLDRGGLTGTGSNGDDVNPIALVNSGPGKATDGIWITDGVASGPAFHTLMASDSNTDYFLNFYGRAYTAGIDLSGATPDSSSVPMIALGSGGNIDLDSAGSGTKIGLSTSDKLGLWNATPIAQPSSTAEIKAGVLEAVGLMASGGAASLDLDGGTLTAGKVTASSGTITSSSPAVDISQTWNSGGVTFTGFKQNITNTASASASLLYDWQVGGVTRLSLDNLGGVYQRGADGSSTGTQWESHANNTTANTTINSIIAHQSAGTAADPKRTQAGQVVLRFSASGYTAVDDTTTAAKVAAHKAAVDLITGANDWTTSDNGMLIRFRTTASGTTTTNAKAFISEQGLELSTGSTTTTARGTTNGTNTLRCFNGTAPSGTLTNGGDVYCEGGEVKVMDSAGNATTISPHDDETGEAIFFTQNTVTGKVFRADIEAMYRKLDAMLGGGYVTEFTDPTYRNTTGGGQGRVVFTKMPWAPYVASVREAH